MIGPATHGLIFFRGGVRSCIGYEVSQTCARLHSGGLGLLPIDFYVTFDEFFTVGKCHLASRCGDDISVIFEGWVEAPDLHEMFPVLRRHAINDPI